MRYRTIVASLLCRLGWHRIVTSRTFDGRVFRERCLDCDRERMLR